MRFVDSHTAGEPTRVIVSGGPDLGGGTLAERFARLREQHDDFRRTAVLEPRGHAAVVGALLVEADNPACATGVMFFNNTGYLGMCGHGTIGVAVTLAYLGRVGHGDMRIETPVGIVAATLHDDNRVTIDNVASYRLQKGVALDVDGLGAVRGDVAWGGNWFFLADAAPCPIDLEHEAELTDAARRIKDALVAEGVTGKDGAEIDHIEFFETPGGSGADSRNFVLCPGDEYDRSPCGTGTSAKVACLADDGKLDEGATWVQESVIGSRFEARYRRDDDGSIVPSITGEAFVCADGHLVVQPGDPFAAGID